MPRIAFFPEAAFGPALNSVGIAQACQKLGHEPVFLCDPGFVRCSRATGFRRTGCRCRSPRRRRNRPDAFLPLRSITQ